MITRIITGVILLAIISFAIYMGGWIFSVIWVAALCLAMYEVYHALSKAGHRPVAWPCWLCLIISIPAFILMKGTNSVALLLCVFYFTFLLEAGIVMFRKNPRLEDLLVSIMPLFTVVLPGLSLLGLLRVEPKIQQQLLITMAFLIPIMGDAGAYFIGIKYGKTKLIPEVSPKKTVAGAVANVFLGVVAASLICLCSALLQVYIAPYWHFVLLGIFGSIAGQLGDLFASIIKRHCKIKDYGHIFPGHGGMMDRLDSILFVTVLIFIYYLAI